MKRSHEDDHKDDDRSDLKRRRGDGPHIELRLLLASKVSSENCILTHLPLDKMAAISQT